MLHGTVAGVDLNRQWATPSPAAHPEIVAAKAVLADLQAAPAPASSIDGIGGVSMYIDLHGHSTKFENFLFGTQVRQRRLSVGPVTEQTDGQCSQDGLAGRVGSRIFPRLFAKADGKSSPPQNDWPCCSSCNIIVMCF